MKRIVSLLLVVLFINACDDGNITVQTIDFSAVSAQKCSAKDVIYKVKDSEMLFIEIPASTFTNDETVDGAPIEVPITGSVKVTYRRYDATVSNNNICPTVPSATPNLLEEWNASSGTIQITATAIKSTNPTTQATSITGYKYYIVFKNITFQTSSGPQVHETFIFGNYTTSVSGLAFGFDTEVDKSSCDNRIFNFNGSESLVLDVADYATLFENTVTTTPRTALLNATNKLTYRLFNNPVTDAYFCATTTPTTPTLSQTWNGVAGVEGISGIIEVSTTTFGSGFQHTIHLKKVSMFKGNSSFYLGDDYTFGSFVTNP
jgi:hypothetical protein